MNAINFSILIILRQVAIIFYSEENVKYTLGKKHNIWSIICKLFVN